MDNKESKPRIGVAKIEGRKDPRFLLNLPLEYSLVNSEDNHAGYTFNASEGGLMVNIPERLEVGQSLKMRLFFSFGPDINTIEILSQVVWTDQSEKDGSYRSGIKFMEITPDDKGRLGRFLQNLMS